VLSRGGPDIGEPGVSRPAPRSTLTVPGAGPRNYGVAITPDCPQLGWLEPYIVNSVSDRRERDMR
jgi:hypothetical protein